MSHVEEAPEYHSDEDEEVKKPDRQQLDFFLGLELFVLFCQKLRRTTGRHGIF